MEKENTLKIYLLSQTTLQAAWTSLLGNKYLHALSFRPEFTFDLEKADVIAWDGFLNAKSKYYLSGVMDKLKSGRPVLLLQREAYTLFKDHPFMTSIDVPGDKVVELSSGNTLPEDLLAALEACYKKLNNV